MKKLENPIPGKQTIHFRRFDSNAEECVLKCTNHTHWIQCRTTANSTD